MPGAARAITQYFFDGDGLSCGSSTAALAAGITAPIVPGIMPVSNFAQAAKFSGDVRHVGASIGWADMFQGTEDDRRDPAHGGRQ